MRLAHKRKIQSKLQKRVKALVTVANEIKVSEKPVTTKPVEVVAKPVASSIVLTEKQQKVLDIVTKNAEGMNSKSIGLEAGQEESKAAAWATGALKKLLENNLVDKVQLSGNKVIYKIK
jgi:hypothetical protein